MNLELAEHPRGTVLAVRVVPGVRRAGVRGVHGGALKVAVAQPAEKGRANEALLERLAALLGVPRRQVSLASGTTSSLKHVLVEGMSRVQLLERIAKAVGARPGER